MKAPDWYPAWRQEAFEQLLFKQETLELVGFGNSGQFRYDLDAGTLTISEEQTDKIRGDIQLVGSINGQDWMWSWANDHWPKNAVEDLLKVRDFGREHGIEELTREHVKGYQLEPLAWALTAVAVRILDSPGAYHAGGKLPSLFFLLRKIDFVN